MTRGLYQRNASGHLTPNGEADDPRYIYTEDIREGDSFVIRGIAYTATSDAVEGHSRAGTVYTVTAKDASGNAHSFPHYGGQRVKRA